MTEPQALIDARRRTQVEMFKTRLFLMRLNIECLGVAFRRMGRESSRTLKVFARMFEMMAL